MKLRKIVITWLSTQLGGAEESIQVLSSAIQAQYNLEVCPIIWKYEPKFSLNVTNSNNSKFHLYNNYQDFIQCISSSISKNPKETVLFSNHRTFIAELKEARQRGVKCAIVFRGILFPDECIRVIPSHKAHKLKAISGSSYHWKKLGEADSIIGISESSANSLKNLLKQSERVIRIYNGVNDQWFLRDTTQIRSIKVPKSFLICSRLVPWKSIHVGLIAFIRLAMEFLSVKLDIIGDGPELSLLQDIVIQHDMEKRVLFHGWQTNSCEWYRKSDCLIHPSSMEGFGRVIAEANACGLVAVGPQSAATGELIINGLTGLTFKSGSSNDCYKVLKKFMLSTHQQRAKMATQAFNRAKVLFSATRMAEEYVSIANQLIQLN